MTGEQWQEIERAFHRISDLPLAERQASLDLLAQTDPLVHVEVLALLEEDEAPHALLAQTEKERLSETMAGKQIQSYRLVRQLEQGGMGTVYLAERVADGFEQQVALKLARTDRGAEALEAHFMQERKILARLQHRNIAALYDGGHTDDGRPFFTMEYVSGLSLTEYCTQKKLSVPERLSLFLQVCEAVAYAHQQLIVHLDLKPGNILVKESGEVKLLDFGLAREEESNSPESNRLTLAYAAPEQLHQAAVSTQTDLYALGVILYELLTGKLPRLAENATRPAWQEAQQAPVPSVFAAPALSALSRLEKQDLEAICVKALALPVQDRYESAETLLADIQAFLEQRPLSLRAQDQAYRFRKYVKRNWRLVGIALLSLSLLVGTVSTYTYRLQQERNLARREALKAQRMVNLMQSVFVEANPDISPDELTAAQLLDEALTRLPEELSREPGLLAEMYRLMSETFLGIGKLSRADSLGRLSLSQLEALGDSASVEVALSLIQWGKVQYSLYEYDRADSLLQRGIGVLKERRPETDSLLTRHSNSLAHVIFDNGDVATADSIYRWVYEQLLQTPNPSEAKIADALHNLGGSAAGLGDFETADSLLLLSLAMKETIYTAPHSELAYTLNELGVVSRRLGRNEAALAYVKKGLAQQIAIFGRSHEQPFATQSNLARFYSALGYYDSAIVAIDTARSMAERIYGNRENFSYAMMTYGLGHVTRLQGDLPRARDLHLEALDLYAKSLGPDHPNSYPVWRSLGEVYRDMQQYERSAEAFQKALDLSMEGNGPEHDDTGYVLELFGKMYLQAGDKEKARSQLERAYQIYAIWPQRNKELLADLAASLVQLKADNSQ